MVYLSVWMAEDAPEFLAIPSSGARRVLVVSVGSRFLGTYSPAHHLVDIVHCNQNYVLNEVLYPLIRRIFTIHQAEAFVLRQDSQDRIGMGIETAKFEDSRNNSQFRFDDGWNRKTGQRC